MNSRLGRCVLTVLTVATLVLQAPKVKAADDSFFAPGCQAWGATNAFVIVPPSPGRVPVVRSIQVLSDLYDSRLTFFSNSAPAIALYDSSGTNIHVQSSSTAGDGGTNGFATGDIVLICHGSGLGKDDTVERARVHAVGTTNISITTSQARTTTAGSLIYRVNTNCFAKGFTNATTTINSGFVYCGQRGQPLLIDASGTAAVTINLCGGEFR